MAEFTLKRRKAKTLTVHIDDLTQDEYNDIVKAWGEASKEEAGIKTGE